MKIRSLYEDKRADLFSLIPMIVILFIIAVFGFLTMYVSWTFTTELNKIDEFNNSENARETNEDVRQLAVQVNEEMVIFFFLGMTIALIIGAVRTQFSPVFIFFFIMLLILAVVLASMEAEMYQALTSDPSVTDYSDQLTFTNIIFSKFTPLIISVIGGMVLLIMYGKSGSDIPQ